MINFETPSYVYDLNLLRQTLAAIKHEVLGTNYKVHYALKANANVKIIEEVKAFGLGLDCVSGNEIQFGLEQEFLPTDILFAGVGKTEKELKLAIENGISCINCESYDELIEIERLCLQLNKNISIALRLNPNVDAKTHEYISTGLAENKFGISMKELNQIIQERTKFKKIRIEGLHFHIGSQIDDFTVFSNLCDKVNLLYESLVPYFNLKFINVGGGMGVNYSNPDDEIIPNFKNYFDIFKKNLLMDLPIYFELGRSIVAQCGTLLSDVLYVKEGDHKKFAIIDAGMTELLRPALYGASHKIEVHNNEIGIEKYDVVGPICESSDCFGKDISLPSLKRGDRVYIRSVGAYAEQMSLRYNMRNEIKNYFLENN